jgi:hypothetical protein
MSEDDAPSHIKELAALMRSEDDAVALEAVITLMELPRMETDEQARELLRYFVRCAIVGLSENEAARIGTLIAQANPCGRH